MIHLQLLISYLKIGLFGFGGGYAMLSLVRYEVVEKNSWLTGSEFTDIVAISQMTPGPIGINSATYIGYTVTGNILGAIIATSAVCLPSFIIFLFIARVYAGFISNRYVESAFSAIRPVTVGLIAAVVLLLMNSENFTDWSSALIFAVAFALTKFLKFHPIILILLAGVAGIIIY